METVKVELELPKEASELAAGIANFLAHAIAAVKDGFQAGDDLPVLLAAAMGDLIPALNGVDQLPTEFKEDKAGFVAAFGYAGLLFQQKLME